MMNDKAADDTHDNELAEALRAAMMEGQPMPAGLVARLQAHVAHARASAERFTIGERVVFATLLFTGLAYVGGAAGVVAGAFVATIYGAVLNTLGGSSSLGLSYRCLLCSLRCTRHWAPLPTSVQQSLLA